MAIQSKLVVNSIETLLQDTGVKPGVWTKEQVGGLIYVVLPLAHPTAKARTGKNVEEVSFHFKGAFMSTRSSSQGRGVVHTSSPFIQFMSELPRAEGEKYQHKPGEAEIFYISSVEEVMDRQRYFGVGVEKTRMLHRITESEKTKKLTVGTRIPYNFRLELGTKELKSLIGGCSDYNEQWEAIKECVPLAQPQLHLLLSIGEDCHVKAENKEVYNMEGVQAYHLTLKPENVLACKWVKVGDELYDTAALLPEAPVDHSSEFVAIDKSEGVTQLKTVEAVLSMKDPFKNVRKLWIKVLTNGTYKSEQLDEFLKTLDGQLGYFWANQKPETLEANLTKLKGCIANPNATAKQVAQAKAEEQLKVAAPSPKKVEEPKTEVKQEVKPVSTPKPIGAFAGMADDDDDFGDLATV